MSAYSLKAGRDEHEAKCRRCGRCCSVKYIVGGVVFSWRSFCEHFDPQTRLCRVYARRREINPSCLDVATGIRMGVFPADCPYVVGVRGYHPPYPILLDAETERLILMGIVQTAPEVIRLLTERCAVESPDLADEPSGG